MSFLKFVFHRLLPDPVPGETWVYDDGDPFTQHPLTITDVKKGWCQFYLTNFGESSPRHSKRLNSLKAFYRKAKP